MSTEHTFQPLDHIASFNGKVELPSSEVVIAFLQFYFSFIGNFLRAVAKVATQSQLYGILKQLKKRNISRTITTQLHKLCRKSYYQSQLYSK